jgi:hypothetical protein
MPFYIIGSIIRVVFKCFAFITDNYESNSLGQEISSIPRIDESSESNKGTPRRKKAARRKETAILIPPSSSVFQIEGKIKTGFLTLSTNKEIILYIIISYLILSRQDKERPSLLYLQMIPKQMQIWTTSWKKVTST